MTTKVPYPQVIRCLLELLELPIDIQGCRRAAEILRSREAVMIRLGPEAGEYAGCYDEERVDKEIGDSVLQQYPQLNPLVQDFLDEGASYCSLCGWLNDFTESVAWLAGDRRLPSNKFVFVKRSHQGQCQCGIMFWLEDRYRIQNRSDEHPGPTEEILGIYPTAFEAALDGWRVD